jgi:hypothetical protein
MVAARRTATGHPATSRRWRRPQLDGHGSSCDRGTMAAAAAAAATATRWSRRRRRPRPSARPPAWSHAHLPAWPPARFRDDIHSSSCDGDGMAWHQWRCHGTAAVVMSSGDDNCDGSDSDRNGGSGLAEWLILTGTPSLDPTTLLDLSIAYCASHPPRLRTLFDNTFSLSDPPCLHNRIGPPRLHLPPLLPHHRRAPRPPQSHTRGPLPPARLPSLRPQNAPTTTRPRRRSSITACLWITSTHTTSPRSSCAPCPKASWQMTTRVSNGSWPRFTGSMQTSTVEVD